MSYNPLDLSKCTGKCTTLQLLIMIRRDNNNTIFTINSHVIYSMIQMINYKIVNVVMIINIAQSHTLYNSKVY